MHVMTAMTRMRGVQPFLGACVLALAGAVLLAGEAWAQPASGYYLSQEIGLNVAPPVELFGNTNDRPSRCDEFINPRFAEVAGCTDPDRGLGAGWKTDYDRAAGMLAGVSAGYRFGGRLRVEAEWFHRESEYDQTSPWRARPVTRSTSWAARSSARKCGSAASRRTTCSLTCTSTSRVRAV